MADDSREGQLTPEARAAEEKWKADHPAGECQCWQCMHAKMPWVEKLDRAQRTIERLENELSEAGQSQVMIAKGMPIGQ